MSIRCGRSNTKMVGMAKSNFPSLPVFPTAGVVKIPGAGFTRIDCSYRVCDFERRVALHVKWSADAAEARVDHDGRDRWTSSGALRAQREKFEGVSGEMKTLVPKKCMDELKSLLDSTEPTTVEFAKDESTLFFPHRIALADLAAAYGTISELRSGPAQGQQQDHSPQRRDFNAAILRVAQFADERSRAVRLKLEKGELKISASSTESGESEDSIEAPYTAECSPSASMRSTLWTSSKPPAQARCAWN